jgi:hypothetical protein
MLLDKEEDNLDAIICLSIPSHLGSAVNIRISGYVFIYSLCVLARGIPLSKAAIDGRSSSATSSFPPLFLPS